jgi:hypothetical protein
MTLKAIREAVSTVENNLLARATGQASDDAAYQRDRQILLDNPEARPLLPAFVVECRSLDQFWSYISQVAPTYAGRRAHVWGALRPVWDFLEAGRNPVASAPTAPQTPPTLDPVTRKAFLSYSMADKHIAAAVKKLLEAYAFECFMAHDDLQVSEKWRERILDELQQCDVFVPLLSTNFKGSEWCAQEVGVVMGRPGVLVVPLILDGTTPYGFIASIQGTRIDAKPTAEQLVHPLLKQSVSMFAPGVIKGIREASTFRGAEAAMAPLVPCFPQLSDTDLAALVEASISNGQVWSAAKCRMEYLPRLIAATGSRIAPDRLKALKYQIDNDRWYVAETNEPPAF